MNVNVTGNPKSLAKGQWQCELSPHMLTLTQRKRTISIPVGSSVSYSGKNKLTVAQADGELEITITKFGSYQNLLASDLAEWLAGREPMPDPGEYGLEWYYYLLCALPIGIPIITMGGALPAMLGFGLAGGNLGIAQKEEWSTAARVFACLGLVAVGYGILVALIVFAAANS